MAGIPCPATFVTADGKLAGHGSAVVGLLEDSQTSTAGRVVAVIFETPPDPAAGWVVLDTSPPRQFRPAAVYSDLDALVMTVWASARKRAAEARRELAEAEGRLAGLDRVWSGEAGRGVALSGAAG